MKNFTTNNRRCESGKSWKAVRVAITKRGRGSSQPLGFEIQSQTSITIQLVIETTCLNMLSETPLLRASIIKDQFRKLSSSNL